MPKMLPAKQPYQGIQYLRREDEQIVMANPVSLFIKIKWAKGAFIIYD